MRQSIGLVFVAILAVCPESAWALANPASVFCAQPPDGRVVNEWSYYRSMHRR